MREKIKKTGLLFVLAAFPLCALMAQESGFAGGEGTERNPYLIKSPQQLSNLRNYLGDSYKDLHYKLGADIDISGYCFQTYGEDGWMPVGNSDALCFDGHLDGNGHSVIGLWLNNSTSVVHAGLFGVTGENCLIENLRVETHDRRQGVLGNRCRAGAIVGYNKGAIRQCSSRATIKTDGMSVRAGGIAGINYGQITDCYSDVIISGNGSNTSFGGIAGENRSLIARCHADVNISKGYACGGLTGSNYGGEIIKCYATGTITKSEIVGGIAGVHNRSAFADGLISRSYADVAVSGTTSAGGLVGFVWYDKALIINCYALGDVSGTGLIGGLIGENYGLITNCYAVNTVTGSNYAGGLIGENRSTGVINNCYFPEDSHIEGVADGDWDKTAVSEPTLLQMMHHATFLFFDFDSIWGIREGWTYPYLIGVGNDFGITANEQPDIEATAFQAYCSGGTLCLKGISRGDEVNIYTIGGQLVTRFTASNNTEYKPLNIKGILIVSSGGRSIKVVSK